MFLDADVVPEPDLLDRYFDPLPAQDTAVLAGALSDEPVGRGAPPAARYAQLEGLMSQENTLGWDDWSFAQTANAACRRSAFEQVGGFREDIRAAEDADLTYRLKAAGWALERRDGARAVHVSRTSLRALLRQRMLHGAGGGVAGPPLPGLGAEEALARAAVVGRAVRGDRAGARGRGAGRRPGARGRAGAAGQPGLRGRPLAGQPPALDCARCSGRASM